MIILDTNVLSEVMAPDANRNVVAWLERVRIDELYITTISQMELLYGVHQLPDGKRKMALHQAIQELLGEEYAERMLSFDSAAAEACALIRADRKQSGKPIGLADAIIAGIARAHNAMVATGDADLVGCGVPVYNPWNETTHS